MKTLIGITDFVLEENRFKEDSDTAIFKTTNYTKFLKQPLELWMFIPCDEDGNVLEEPIETIGGVEMYVKRYQQAKKRCLFEGWNYNIAKFSDNPFIELRDENNNYLAYDVDDKNFQYAEELFTDSENKNIEDIVKYNLQLTSTAQKQL